MLEKPYGEDSSEANAAWWKMLSDGDFASGKYPNTTMSDVMAGRESLWRRCKNCDRVQHLEKHGRECNRCGEVLED